MLEKITINWKAIFEKINFNISFIRSCVDLILNCKTSFKFLINYNNRNSGSWGTKKERKKRLKVVWNQSSKRKWRRKKETECLECKRNSIEYINNVLRKTVTTFVLHWYFSSFHYLLIRVFSILEGIAMVFRKFNFGLVRTTKTV